MKHSKRKIMPDDYAVDGVSINSKEAEEFHRKLQLLKKKYGIIRPKKERR